MIDPDIPASETIHRIPEIHWDSYLHTFVWERTSIGSKGEKAITAFLRDWREGEAPHLLLVGEPGLGKTHLGVGIYRVGVYVTDLVQSVYIHVPSFCDSLKASYGDYDSGDPYREIRGASLLVLDDLFGRELSHHESEQIIPRILSIAYDNTAALVVTTNYNKEEIASRLHSHETSRLFANSRMLMFKGEDQRLA